jgi:hypothetical protein
VLGPSADADANAIHVRSSAEFGTAVAALRDTGGTIRLGRNDYGGELVVPLRSARPLHIVGERGVRIESLLLERTQHVSISRLTIAPLRQDAWLRIRGSRHITLDDLLVTAQRTHFRATVQVAGSSHVSIRRSEFRHCGDRSPLFSNCVHLKPHTRHIRIVDNRFHDCRGCDFVHGRFGYDLTLRRNRFERALPCRMGRDRCGHQDLVQLWSGNRLLVEQNTFGVYKLGAAQLYLARAIDDATIVNNVFRGTDPKVRGYRARVAIIVGSKGSKRVPLRVGIVNNTILSGARRIDGYAGSIRMSSVYWSLQRRKRPLLANNVIGLLEVPHHVCSVARRAVSNIVLRGVACRGANLVGDVHLDANGRPTPASTLLIDRASRRFGASRDIDGRLRDSRPDIGAFEYRGTKPRSRRLGTAPTAPEARRPRRPGRAPPGGA